MQTKGWELTVGYNDSYNLGTKPLSVNAKFILSDSRSYITKFKNEQELFSSFREGQEIGEIWGLTSDGLFENTDQIDQLDQTDIIPWGALSIVPGWPRYIDQDGDGKITRGLSARDPKDLSVIGNTTQRFRMGLNLSADWNGFDFSVLMQGVGMADYYPSRYLFWGPYQQPYANVYPWNLDFYRGTSETGSDRERHSASYLAAGLADANTDNPAYPVLQSWMADANYGGGLDIPQTRYLLSAAYLRIKNVALGYSLPAAVLQKIKLSRLRFYVSAENLFEFSSIKRYVDPEAINANDESTAYPFQRRLSFGVNLQF